MLKISSNSRVFNKFNFKKELFVCVLNQHNIVIKYTLNNLQEIILTKANINITHIIRWKKQSFYYPNILFRLI